MGFLAAIPAALSTVASTAAGAASSASSSLLGGLGSAFGSVGSGSVGGSLLSTGASLLAGKALQPPKPPAPPQPPNPASAFTKLPSLFSPSEGTAGGTFLTGSNKAANIAGGKKTLLGQ